MGHGSYHNLSREDERVLNELCKQFELRWRAATEGREAGSQPPILEEFLDRVDEPLRCLFLRELLLIEWRLRTANGELVSPAEYRSRFSDRADTVDFAVSDFNAHHSSPGGELAGDFLEISTSRGDMSGTGDWQPETTPTLRSRPADRQAALTPERIGRFNVLGTLGTGSFGTVYLARDEQLKRPVAIKVPHPQKTDQPAESDFEGLELFRAEAQKAAALHDPHIVPVYDVGQLDDGRPFIVSRYVEGSDLATRLKAGPVERTQAVEIVEHLARALHHAHHQGLVHRDIKPHNILIDEKGQPVVADFGLALFEEERRQWRGTLVGTPAYMSPEQVRGETQDLDGRSDIWSLGVVLYEMLTQRRPFTAPNSSQLFEAIEEDRVKPPRQIDDSIPAELECILLKCLEKDPDDRYTTARDLADDLQRWRRRAARHAEGWWRPIAGWAAGLVGAAVLAAVIWLPRSTPQPPLEGSLDLKREFLSSGGREPAIETFSQAPFDFRIASGNLVQISSQLNRPAYVYLLWIEADGNVLPVYPWENFDWTTRQPELEKPVVSVSRPDETQGWPVGGPAGIETLVLLARDKPLPADAELQQRLDGGPKLDLPPGLRRRGPRTPVPRPLGAVDDSQRRKLLQDRLQEYFSLMEMVSFINLGHVQPPE